MRESITPRPMTFAQYMKAELTSPVRHEFVRGEVFAMVGGTARHNRITGNVFARLKAAEAGTTCRAYVNDVKVRVDSDTVYYPDVVVECVPRGPEDLILDQPCVVVEVTSKGTRRVDRGEKQENYRRIESLRLYLIVDQTRRRVTRHWRADSGWKSEELAGTGSIPIPCLDTTLTLDQIYEDVEMPPLGVAEPDYDTGVEDEEYAW
jgi:Uma2 family endonuclease